MTGLTRTTARRAALGGAILVASLLCALPALAVDATTDAALMTPAATTTTTSPTSTDNMRLIQSFFEDAAIANQWWEAQFRYESGAFPPLENADGFRLGGVMAINVFKNVELGGRVAFADYNLDHTLRINGSDFDGESGATDLDLFGKYRFGNGPVKWAVGGSFSLPTGSEDDGLGTGEVNPSIFGAVRGNLSADNNSAFTGVAHLGFRFNQDATILHTDLSGKTSVFAGVGVLVRLSDTFGWTGEINFESERYENFDSDIRITGGAHWDFSKHSTLRGGASVGLADAAPDFELIGSYVYHF